MSCDIRPASTSADGGGLLASTGPVSLSWLKKPREKHEVLDARAPFSGIAWMKKPHQCRSKVSKLKGWGGRSKIGASGQVCRMRRGSLLDATSARPFSSKGL